MGTITVGKLRAIASGLLDELTGLDDGDRIVTYPNTYGMYGTILETCEGFIDVHDVEFADDYEDEDQEE